MQTQHILDGYRVLDITQHIAGPTVTRLMVEMGAEVIKVEILPYGDPTRLGAFRRDKRSGLNIQHNRGKKSLCLDVKSEKGRQILKELVEKCDVILENFAPGVIGRMGLDWETVKSLNPKAVMCSISAFGQTGPLAPLPGFDYIAQAYAGVTDMIGDADGPPSIPQLALGDVGTGVHAACAIGYALLHRERTGKGQFLDISLLDCYFHAHEANVELYSGTQGKVVPTRNGSQHYSLVPVGVYRSKEGYILILAHMENHWKNLCGVIGNEALTTEERFTDPKTRIRAKEEIVAIIEQWLQAQESDQAAIELLQQAHVPVAPVLTIGEAISHPHLVERGTVQTVNDRILGEFKIPGNPLRYSEFPEPLPLDAPFLGEHNKEVLTEILAYSDEDVAAMESEKIIRQTTY
ncbi:MAG: CoA transferase [Pseudomonadales bacterium]|nr:CoA transferase [Pseudomonadales bacterium]